MSDLDVTAWRLRDHFILEGMLVRPAWKWIAIVGWVVAMSLLLIAADSRTELEREMGKSICYCKPEIKGRQFYASVCQAPSIKGPWQQECLYRL